MTDTPKQLPLREDVPVAMTWDLTKIFENDEAFEAAFSEVQAILPKAQTLKGTLGNGAQAFLEALEYIFNVSLQLE